MKKLVMLLPLLFAAGCGTSNGYLAHNTSTVEMYHIFDIKTAASASEIGRAASDGLGKNTTSVSANTPLLLDVDVPEKPGRFIIGGRSAKPAAAGGAAPQVVSTQGRAGAKGGATCEGAAWTARAVRTVPFSDNPTLYACLYKYKEGYHLDTYVVYQKTEGGLLKISRNLANRLRGTPESWVNKAIWDMVRNIEGTTQAKATWVEGQPELGPEPVNTQVAASSP